MKKRKKNKEDKMIPWWCFFPVISWSSQRLFYPFVTVGHICSEYCIRLSQWLIPWSMDVDPIFERKDISRPEATLPFGLRRLTGMMSLLHKTITEKTITMDNSSNQGFLPLWLHLHWYDTINEHSLFLCFRSSAETPRFTQGRVIFFARNYFPV